jgi:hypothetical protein
VRGFRECTGPGIKRHGLWNIEYPEEKDELCEALALASVRGVKGPGPNGT